MWDLSSNLNMNFYSNFQIILEDKKILKDCVESQKKHGKEYFYGITC